MDQKAVVKVMEQFMHRENARPLGNSVKNARIETTSHLNVFRRKTFRGR